MFIILVAVGMLTVTTIALVVFARMWTRFEFWCFVKFGKRFKDREEKEEVANLEQRDYDAFISVISAPSPTCTHIKQWKEKGDE